MGRSGGEIAWVFLQGAGWGLHRMGLCYWCIPLCCLIHIRISSHVHISMTNRHLLFDTRFFPGCSAEIQAKPSNVSMRVEAGRIPFCIMLSLPPPSSSPSTKQLKGPTPRLRLLRSTTIETLHIRPTGKSIPTSAPTRCPIFSERTTASFHLFPFPSLFPKYGYTHTYSPPSLLPIPYVAD